MDDKRVNKTMRILTYVVTGIPMEFQFGTNWAGFSKYAGADPAYIV